MAKTLALVGSDSQLGREIRDLFPGSGLHADLRLLAAGDEEAGHVTRLEDELVIVGRLERATLEDADVVLLAGGAASARQAAELEPDTVLVDLSYATEQLPSARIRAPWTEPLGYVAPRGTVHVAAHPAALTTVLLLSRLNAVAGVRRAVVNVLEPASERGRAGMEELQVQSVNLLSFKGLPKKVYDAQVAFNLLAAYGEEAPEPLSAIEQRIERHVTSLSASGGGVLPSLRVIQAPVFHGYGLSFWVELERNVPPRALETALALAPVDLHGEGLAPPNLVGMAGQSGIAVGAFQADRNHPQAYWFWAVADNIRLMAENALAIAERLL